MSQIELILKYQEEETKLREIDKEINATPERQAFLKARKQLSLAQDELKKYDNSAAQLRSAIERLQTRISELEDQLGDFDNIDEDVEGGGNVSFYKKNAQMVMDEVRSLKVQLSKIVGDYRKVSEAYTALRNQTVPIQKKYNEVYVAANKKVMLDRQPDKDKIQKRMEEISHDIDPTLMKRYEARRQEKVIPVVTAVKNDRCSGCGAELTLIAKDKIKTNGFVECENCGRILYVE